MHPLANEIVLEGKVSHLGPTEYTPNGIALMEVKLAGGQEFMGRTERGYFDLLAVGDATRQFEGVRVGSAVSIRGSLWNRRYKDRRGQSISEVKVLVKELKKLEDR